MVKMNIMTFSISNPFGRNRTVIIEPWVHEIELGAQEQVTVQVTSEQEGEMEITLGEDLLTIYLWPTSTFRLFRNGVEIPS